MTDQAARPVPGPQGSVLEQARRRALQLEAVAEVSGAASSVLDLEQLLPMAAELIRDRFDLYYAGIFLVDEEGARAVLRAGTGDAGRQMMQDGHALQVGGKSMIGWSVAQLQPRIALDVDTDQIRFDNPLLPETRSEMALPLISRGRALGAMTIQSVTPSAFVREDVTVLQIMADQLANAIDNARLFQERERRITELGIVNEIGEALASALSVDELLLLVHQQVSRLFDAKNFYIAIYDEDDDTWSSAFHLEQGRRQAPVRYGVETGLTGHIIRERKPVLLRSAAESISLGDERGIEIIGEIARSWLGVPLLAADKLVGVMAIQDYERECLYTEADQVLFSTIAGQVAGALNSLQLLQEARQRAQEMETINRFGEALSACQDLKGVLQVVHAGVQDLLIIDDLYVSLYDSETGEVTSALRIVDGQVRTTGTSWTLGRGGLIDYLIHSRRPLLLADRVVERIEEMGIATVPVRSERAPASWLGAPITLGERVLGTIVVLHRTRPRIYGEHSQELLMAVADRTALALQSVYLLAETRAALAEVQATHRNYLRRGWEQHLRQRSLLAEGTFVHQRDAEEHAAGIRVVRGFWRPEIDHALEASAAEEPGEEDEGFGTGLAVPISLRGQAIGILGVEFPAGDERWTDEDRALIEAIGEQLAQTLEAARLFADTERRAERERLIGEISAKVRASTDVRAILEIAATELGRALGTSRAMVQLDLAPLGDDLLGEDSEQLPGELPFEAQQGAEYGD
jgi:GAF domain-containing protein